METIETIDNERKFYATREDVLARVQQLAEASETPEKSEVELLKQLFYKYNSAALAQAKEKFVAEGGDPNTYLPEPNTCEEQFRQAMSTIRERRAAAAAELEKEKEANMKRKLDILERIQALAATPEEASAAFDEFKQLQAEWKEIKMVPAEKATELWKNFQLYVEKFYDLLKLGHEMREYDFKKNLDTKIAICEKTEALAQEEDIIAAFNQLQALHQEWKETGPVAKDLREELWTRFKDASTVINKKHQAHFEAIKAREEENLEKKTELCQRVELLIAPALNPDSEEAPGTFAQWDAITKEIQAAQTEWKALGYAPQKQNAAIFERFRMACDTFFERKADFFHQLKDSLNENLARKKELVAKAEALKESTDWKATSDALIDLQKQWREIGAVPKKYSEELWKSFIGACDAFFDAKQKATSGERQQQKQNLEQKKEIIAQLTKLAEEGSDKLLDTVKELQAKWNEIGHVPFKEKDSIYAEYRAICDKLYEGARNSRIASRTASRIQHIQQNLGGDRQRLQRAYDNLKAEIQTYENNIGFLSASSKKGNALVDQMLRKVEGLKAELAEIKKQMTK